MVRQRNKVDGMKIAKYKLKGAPKCDIFHLFDFNEFYVIKSL